MFPLHYTIPDFPLWPSLGQDNPPPLSRTPSPQPNYSLPGLFDCFPYNHPVCLIQLFGDPFPHQMLPITIKC